jgi:hypothetical protein
MKAPAYRQNYGQDAASHRRVDTFHPGVLSLTPEPNQAEDAFELLWRLERELINHAISQDNPSPLAIRIITVRAAIYG